jgi:hypothetical protein
MKTVETGTLHELWSAAASEVERRLLAEYGAIFVTAAVPPPVISFADETEVQRFQSSLEAASRRFGEHMIELQAPAMEALAQAAQLAQKAGRSITARAADAGRRSFEDTVKLWTRNVTRGLEHWKAFGRIDEEKAEAIRRLPPLNQVPLVLDLEQSDQLYFGTYFDKSILYSVAAPGASQHLSMLAFDVAEYQDDEVELILNDHGWYRTVMGDLPHFTFLGRAREALPEAGLKLVERDYAGKPYRFWVPDLDQ